MSTALTVRWIRPSTKMATWNLAASESGLPFECPDFGDKTVTVTGTFGAASVLIEGSNDGTNWLPTQDFVGVTPVSFAAAGMKVLASCPRYIRPTAGAGQTVTVIIIARGSAR